MKRIITIALVATTLGGLGACSSDSKSSGTKLTVPSDLSIPNITLPSDVSLPSDLSLPGNLTEECRAIALQFATLYSQVFAPQGEQADLTQVFGDVSSKVPADLQDDLAVMSTAFAQYAQILTDNGNDMTKPEVQAALEALGTPEVQAASDNIDAYFEATCPD